jgi:hypothetical protein
VILMFAMNISTCILSLLCDVLTTNVFTFSKPLSVLPTTSRFQLEFIHRVIKLGHFEDRFGAQEHKDGGKTSAMDIFQRPKDNVRPRIYI